MSRYIDAEILKERLIKNITLTNAIDRSFNEAPSIDIVRCKECRRSYIEGQTTLYRVCGFHDITTDENNYCSWAEREGDR